jgi:hypothetical protein
MHTFISKPKPPVIVYYSGKHVSRVFEDLRKMKAPNSKLIDITRVGDNGQECKRGGK